MRIVAGETDKRKREKKKTSLKKESRGTVEERRDASFARAESHANVKKSTSRRRAVQMRNFIGSRAKGRGLSRSAPENSRRGTHVKLLAL